MTVQIISKNCSLTYTNVKRFHTEYQKGNGHWIIIRGKHVIEKTIYLDPFPEHQKNDLTELMEKQGELDIGYDPRKDEIRIW